jgi:hypothetical protein
VIARFCSFGALVHQHRVLHESSLPYLSEDWDSSSYQHWIMYFDGSLKLGGDGAGVLFISPRGEQLKYVFQILFDVSNNEAEYEVLLQGLA